MSGGAGTKRVLVTGATGFLGGNVLAALGARGGVEAIAACRTPDKLPPDFTGEVRPGDLLDAGYRRAAVEGVDVVCHTGTWASFWGHAVQERTHFFEPARDLVDQAVAAGVGRFLLASTVAVAAPRRDGEPVGDFATTRPTGFWPHLDRLIDLDAHMREQSGRGTQMVTMRLGHFVGAGNQIGVVAALAPRLRTRLVPWVARGRARLPLVGDRDLGQAFALAATAEGLDHYESFNICGPKFPTTREVIEFMCDETGFPRPWFSVPYGAGYAFGWAMEKLHPLLPGTSPFLTRSLVHVSEDWYCPVGYATGKIGYVPVKDWRVAMREALADRAQHGYRWPPLAQAA